MNASEYIKATERTDLPRYDAVAARLKDEKNQKLLHYAMGVVTEGSELIDALKKHLMYGKPLDEVNLKEEIGDALWYIARACDLLGTSIEAVMERNIEKLKHRFPEKFTESHAVNRDVGAERRILERRTSE